MTATDPNSDYNTNSTDLFQLLPQPYQSDTNRSIMSNLFNRFLSKEETVHTVGYIGMGNLQAVVPRQIKEPTVHRQAYQLQPILYEKIGSVEHISSWYDILNGLTAQGVEITRQGFDVLNPTSSYKGWAAALEFNWAPPIDINKIVNYGDYYWYDPNDIQSQPQYITVKSECTSANALVDFYQNLITQNGATYTIVGLIPTSSSIIIEGNFATMFAAGFIFYIENSTNTDLNDTFQTVVSSTYNATENETTIVIQSTFTDNTVSGDISLTQQLTVYQNIATCKCTGYQNWNSSTGCTNQVLNTGLNQWISENRWVHKADITNFTIAKRAQIPIIEFEPELELSEWTYTTYTWEYRSSIQNSFAATTFTPTRLELEPLNLYTNTSTTITFDERYGDLTSIFVPGFKFAISGITQLWVVQSSVFQRVSLPYGAFQTTITLTSTLPTLTPSINYVYPATTSVGDPFTKYGDQWLFIGINTTTAINHQSENNMVNPSAQPAVLDSSGNFNYRLLPYGEEFDIINSGVTTLTLSSTYIPPGSTRTLQQRSLVGTNDIRVYLNGIRQYGTYDENGTVYVTGVTFFTALQPSDIVQIQVGEATYQDFGNYAIPVRTILNDVEYAAVGSQLVSLVQYRLAEQVKTGINQYPLFDIYYTNSQPAGIANPIFGYYQSSSGVLYSYVGQRIVQADDGSIEFQNYLVKTNNGELYAYRNYNKSVHTYWYNPNTSTVYVWTGETWSSKYETSGGVWISPVVQAGLPTSPVVGLIAYNTTNNTLQQWNGAAWESLTSFYISTSDETLETNWRHGTNNEQFIAEQVDWQVRTYAEYTADYNAYIAQGNTDAEWTQIQDKYIVPSWYTDTTTPAPVTQGPLWIGNWQIPDPLYYNVDHEDWQYISLTDLQTHFTSIVTSQPSVPGFGGQASANWRLIDYTNINWGLGGTIKEYDNSFDTFLSTQFIDTVTPPSLFTFAQSQYEDIILMLRDIMSRNLVTYMTNVTTSVILDPSAYISSQVITNYEENESANLIYGDSTTYTEATATTPATGIQNWIATLPYFGIVPKVAPYIFNDPHLGIAGVMHHDGHRATYALPQTTIIGLQQVIVNSPDTRAGTEKIGRISLNNPPKSQATFITQFSSVLRNGVYWLQGTTLYRLMVANVGTSPPSIPVPDGSLWWDTGTATLRQQLTVGGTITYPPAPGFAVGGGLLYNGATVQSSTISAWQVIDLNQIYLDVILAAEIDLYNQAPAAPITPPINFAALQAEDSTLYETYLQQQFNAYCLELQIATPFANNTYTATNPFTWNYKYSTLITPPRSGSIPSGGTWQDVYTKAYGTPYPHLEPWALQGYVDKPTWWDTLFLNTNPQLLGTRRWRYSHGIPVIATTPTAIVFAGNVAPSFTGFDSFTMFLTDNVSKQVFTITNVVYALGNTTVSVAQATTSVLVGALAAVGMWDYILRGAIPVGYATPNVSSIPQYLYVSVNISNNSYSDGSLIYNPDDVFPPYWAYMNHFPSPVAAINVSVRSLFDNISEIDLENADYVWNDSGPIQWQWEQTTNYLYGLLTVAYLMEPVRTIQAIFGTKFNYINQLPVDSLTGQVMSHTNTNFHGEITTGNQIVSVNGINQWYVNFNRYAGFDASYSDFRALWTAWTAPLTYLYGGFIDTTSLSVQHRVVSISPQDYNVTIKRSPGVANFWIDAFEVLITNVPPNLNQYDTQNQWELQVSSLAPVARTISYYGVQQYDFYANPITSICTLFSYPIVAANATQNSFTVAGNVSQVFGLPNGTTTFEVAGNNAGSYTVISSSYDPTLDQTVILTSGVPTSVPGGMLTATNYRTIPWATGTLINLATTEFLPLPLETGLQYFINVLTPTTFQLFYSQLDMTANIPILFTSQPAGIQRIGTLYNSFVALNGANSSTTWSHYTVDKTFVKQTTLPATINGIQDFINLVDGYSAYQKNQGFGINVEGSYTDPATSQPVSWQNELERFIDWAYQQRTVRRTRMSNKYAVDINYTAGSFTFTSQNPGYLPGTPVVVWSFGGGLPNPLLIGQTYYIINNTDGSVSLASNYQNAAASVAIPITYQGGVGQIYISNAELYAAELPTYELNPFRNALWFSPPYGIVSNIIVGPFADVFSEQLIFDQYGRRLSPSDVRVFRQDKITQIQFEGGVYNDVQPIYNQQFNPYQYLHIGGANIYLDTYEHMMWFNDYTTAGALIYEPFLGLNITKFELDVYKQDSFTERPNVGGYFLSQPYNQGGELLPNLEESTNILRYIYDSYQVPETFPEVLRARALLGYTGVTNYLSQINLTAKSQFLFWKGAIHSKGSLNAITAFINSRRFVNASVDEFWAYKVADYGSTKIPEYLGMYLTINDTIANELRLQFELTDQICLPGYGIETFGDTDCGYANPPNSTVSVSGVDPTFTAISMTDQTRWYNQPDVLETLVPDGGVLYFDLIPKQKLVIYTASTIAAFISSNVVPLTSEVGVIINTTTTINGSLYAYSFWTYNGSEFIFAGGWNPLATIPTLPIFRHNFMADAITMTMEWYPGGTQTTISSAPAGQQLSLTIPYLPLTNSLSVFKDGTQLQIGVDFVESLEPYPAPVSIDHVAGGIFFVVGDYVGVFTPTTEFTVASAPANDGTYRVSSSTFDGTYTQITPTPAVATPTAGGGGTIQVATILGYKLYFADTISGSKIEVVYGPSQLGQDTQFQLVNTNIVNLLSQELVENLFTNNSTLTIWGLEVNKEAENPAYVIDTEANVSLTPLTFWDPARGYHYYEALNTINVQSNTDPANYDITTGGLAGWKQNQVGITWMDTTNLDYLPYYDTLVETDQETRFANWGKLADNGAIHIYEWVGTSYSPSEYNAIAAVQEGDSSIDASVRLSGTVRQDVRYRNRAYSTATVTASTAGNSTIVLTAPAVSTDSTGLVSTTNYSFTITVNGTFTRTVTALGSTMPTMTDLLRILTAQLATYNATITLSGASIVVASNTIGSGSSIAISEFGAGAGLFSSLTNPSWAYSGITATAGAPTTITLTNPSEFPAGNYGVIFSSTGTLPTGLAASTVYNVTISGSTVTLPSGTAITSVGSGTLTVANSVWTSNWTLDIQQRVDLDAAIDASVSGTVYTFEVPSGFVGKTVNIYVNGASVGTNTTLSTTLSFDSTTLPKINHQDRVSLIIPVHVPTATELAFNPSTADDGTTQIQYQYITNYVATQQFDTTLNAASYTYYYWVENKTTPPAKNTNAETITQAASDILAPPAPYMFFAAPITGGNNGQPLPPSLVANTETGETITEPYRFSQAIVRGLRGYVDDENRYVIRWTRDFSLRDSLKFGPSPLALKAYHQEWFMFREQQLSNVPLDLWNKITEAMAGYLLTDSSTRVPSLARQLYDATYGKSTQYGIGTDQAFCNGATAIATITAYLNDPANNFYPTDMDNFFATYNFNTPANCIATMNAIYTTFNYINVNQMFFSVLLDALSVQPNYAGLMKTSAIALYGIELLDVAGVFDD